MFCAWVKQKLVAFVLLQHTLYERNKPPVSKTSWSPAWRAGRIFRDVMCARRGSVRAGAQLRTGEHKQNRPAAVSGLFYVVVIIS